jgi:hypothetical protein
VRAGFNIVAFKSDTVFLTGNDAGIYL